MLGSSSVQWDQRIPLGSKAVWTLLMYQADGVSPYEIAGHTYEYVVRVAPDDTSSTPLVRLQSDNPGSPVPANGGLISVTSTAVQSFLTLTWYPAATSVLTDTTYYHGLWQDYADPLNRQNLWWGQFMIDGAVQP